MTKLYYASELKEITEQNMSKEAKELLEVVAREALEQAKRGGYEMAFGTYHMKEIEHILKRKGYKIVYNTLSDTHIISWD
ncbi:hypothetical protein P3U41_06185 [Mammaliicoccus sciuri]|uniref:hypothetical protein n=1 Tax=Mammaliicoccus sciuri TaxID=1296 RepID=UPI002B25E660|nr:hypothetical protein [Mammaliicoccus sciuri]WQL34360.1 hypothetical protein P3U41_06185 [Mammaliicoccus sciuri]WQL61299.1 hypothetical protein P3T96_06185 [Mammaliicoccus sciuri]